LVGVGVVLGDRHDEGVVTDRPGSAHTGNRPHRLRHQMLHEPILAHRSSPAEGGFWLIFGLGYFRSSPPDGMAIKEDRVSPTRDVHSGPVSRQPRASDGATQPVRVAGQTEKLQVEFCHVLHSIYPVPSSKQVLPWVSPASPRCSPSSEADPGWWSSPPGSLSCRSSR